MGIQLQELVRASLDDACRELIPAAPEGSSRTGDPALCRTAVIGFAGGSVQGTLGLAASEAGLRRIFQATGGEGEFNDSAQRQAEDALAELSNLILGRLKRVWLRKGIEISLATPLVIRGISIEVRGGRHHWWTTCASEQGTDRVTAWLDVHGDESIVVSEEDVEEELVAEGETLLF